MPANLCLQFLQEEAAQWGHPNPTAITNIRKLKRFIREEQAIYAWMVDFQNYDKPVHLITFKLWYYRDLIEGARNPQTIVRNGNTYQLMRSNIRVVAFRSDVNRFRVNQLIEWGTSECDEFLELVNRLSKGFQRSFEFFQEYMGFIKIMAKRRFSPDADYNERIDMLYESHGAVEKLSSSFIAYQMKENPEVFDELFQFQKFAYSQPLDLTKCPCAQEVCMSRTNHNNACVFNILLQTFAKGYQKLTKEKLTIEKLEEILDIKEGGCSVRLALRFFRKFHIKFVAYDVFENVQEEYIPEEQCQITPSVFYCMVHDRHMYRLTNFIRARKARSRPLNSKYPLPSASDKEGFITCVDDIAKLVAKNKTAKYIRAVYNGDFEALLHELISKHHYRPMVSTTSGRITRLYMRFDELTFSVGELADNTQVNKDTGTIIPEDQVGLYQGILSKLNTQYFSRSCMSYYHPKTLKLLRTCYISPMRGRLVDENYFDDCVAGIDVNTAYTSYYRKIKFPVFMRDDKPQPYGGEPLEDYSLYFVEALSEVATDTPEIFLLKNRVNCLSGFSLKILRADLGETRWKIVMVLKPSGLAPNQASGVIREAMTSGLPMPVIKHLLVKNIGLLEKKTNKTEQTRLFKSRSEADYYFRKAWEEELGRRTQPDAEPQDVLMYDLPHDYWLVVTNKHEVELTEGFLPIKVMILDRMRLALYQLHKKMTSEGYRVIGVRTDNLWVTVPKNKVEQWKAEGKQEKDLKKKDPFGMMGKTTRKILDSEGHPELNLIKRSDEVLPDDLIEPDVVPEQVQLKDEYDEEEFNEIVSKHSRVLTRGSAGTGKTYLNQRYLGDKPHLVIAPTKVLAMDKGGITIDKFVGLVPGLNKPGWIPKNLHKKYSAVLFTEIFSYRLYLLQCIGEIMQENPEVKYLADGDPYQNLPVESLNIAEERYLQAINRLFPFQIYLEIIKRLKTDEDRKTMKKIFHEIFVKQNDMQQIARKYFTVVKAKDLHAKQGHITYHRDTSAEVNLRVHNKRKCIVAFTLENSPIKYYVGLSIICKGEVKQKRERAVRNALYVILQHGDSVTVGLQKAKVRHEINRSKFEVGNILNLEKKKTTSVALGAYLVVDRTARYLDLVKYTTPLELSKSELLKFELSYARTGHSSQGTTITGPYVIHDLCSKYLTRRWFFTAVSRTERISDVKICCENLRKQEIPSEVIERRIAQHRAEDMKKGRVPFEPYVDVRWVREQMESSVICRLCQEPYEVAAGSKTWSIDRLNNLLPHTMNNCQIICVTCNKSKK